jgi:hypothetical protein
MPSQRLYWYAVAENTTTASIMVDDESMRLREYSWHAFVSWTGTAPSNVQVEYAPVNADTADGSTVWFAPTALLFTAQGDVFFQAKPRKFRVIVTGGDGTTAVNVDVR